jgi:dTDP-4-amino-4,6-dideoxy-D-galactose acyltransferase
VTAEIAARCTFLPWDSNFFSKRIASVVGHQLNRSQLDEVSRWAQQNAIDCLYYQVDPNSSDAPRDAGRAGFFLVDVRLTLVCMDLPSSLPPEGVRVATEDDLPRLREIASYSHRDTRFYFDRNLRPASDALYAMWIERSLLEGLADVVLVLDGPQGATGYVTCRSVGDGVANIGLLAVANDARGQGRGGQLLQAALAWLQDRGTKRVTVVTQVPCLANIQLNPLNETPDVRTEGATPTTYWKTLL